jgi:hypothetical protein
MNEIQNGLNTQIPHNSKNKNIIPKAKYLINIKIKKLEQNGSNDINQVPQDKNGLYDPQTLEHYYILVNNVLDDKNSEYNIDKISTKFISQNTSPDSAMGYSNTVASKINSDIGKAKQFDKYCEYTQNHKFHTGSRKSYNCFYHLIKIKEQEIFFKLPNLNAVLTGKKVNEVNVSDFIAQLVVKKVSQKVEQIWDELMDKASKEAERKTSGSAIKRGFNKAYKTLKNIFKPQPAPSQNVFNLEIAQLQDNNFSKINQIVIAKTQEFKREIEASKKKGGGLEK